MKGVPINEALYSTLNQFEETRSTAMTPTKSLSYVCGVYQGIKKSLEVTCQPPTQVFYCDQPQGEHLKQYYC
jgi:hypothetical protein